MRRNDVNDIVMLLRTQPFRSLRVYLSDGSSYEISHPGTAKFGRSEVLKVIKGLDKKSNRPSDQEAEGEPVHIKAIKPIIETGLRRKTKGLPRKK